MKWLKILFRSNGKTMYDKELVKSLGLNGK